MPTEPTTHFAVWSAPHPLVWQPAPSAPHMPAGQVHLWRLSLDEPDPHFLDAALATLSNAEKSRADRFRFALHRTRFITSHGLLRSILARYLAIAPAQVDFEYGPWGKPRLAAPLNAAQLEFSLSHSESLALIAVAQARPLGIDLEWLLRPIDVESIARHFFTPEESAALARAPADSRTETFVRLWTRKESVLKAHGLGLAALKTPDDPAPAIPLHPLCQVHELHPAPSFLAALALMPITS